MNEEHRICNNCHIREGDLVRQVVMPSFKPHISEPWVFRYYLCRWCRGAWNRYRLPTQQKITVLKYRPDAELVSTKEGGEG